MAHHHHAAFHAHRHVLERDMGLPALNTDIPVPILSEADVSLPIGLVKRQSDSSENRPTGHSAATIAIAVSVVVPVVFALILFIYLHRRSQKKLAIEDMNDPHKSFDFGIDPALNPGRNAKKGKKGQPEMATNEALAKTLHGRGGMSVDIGGSPYFLPPDMHHSQESLASFNRSLGHGGDPYRPATNFYERGTTPSLHGGDDAASVRTGSSIRTGRGAKQDGMKQNLLRNAQRMSSSGPPPPINELPDSNSDYEKSQEITRKKLPVTTQVTELPTDSYPAQKNEETEKLGAPVELDATQRLTPSPSPGPEIDAVRRSNNYLAKFIHSREASIDGSNAGQAPTEEQPHALSPPSAQDRSVSSMPIPQISIEAEFPGANLSGNNEIVVPPPPHAASRAHGGTVGSPTSDVDVSTPFYTPIEQPENPLGLGVSDVDFDSSKRLSILRPLPPDDPADTAEQRANRIRSFYKEYFNETEARAYQPDEDYEEDYGSEFLGDATVFDPVTGQFVVAHAAYASPVTRRAMTPPPRGPPRRFQGPGRSSSGSQGGPMPPRGRAYSSASTSRMGPGARPPPKRLPPPKALRTLPTPHLLKEDAFVLPIDFAPPSSVRDKVAGRPDSPFMKARPFSPAVPIASPLASAYNDLPVMPSPHMLRKSGTFTALDFAPPPKFRDGGMSDAGSIRSGRSGNSSRSAAQVHNIRAGTYRISRIPTDLVGSKKQFEQSLRPQWKLGN